MKKVLESYPSDFNEEELHSIEELFRLTTIYYQKTYLLQFCNDQLAKKNISN